MAIKAQQKPLTLLLLTTAFVVLWMVLAAFPFIWTLWGSFKVEGDFFSKADWANAIFGKLTQAETGGAFTAQGYEGAWIQEEFWRAALNTLVVCLCVVTISLTFGTLGAYALSRSTYTLWMLHSFFNNIPKDLDESAMVDGCTRFQAFRYVIVPVMWPGVITTALFSFLLAYNDFAVTTMLLSKENQTMVPKIASFLGTTQTKGNVMFAVAAVVSVTAPLFVMILFFQRQIVSGLTAGAVKG